jgi:hypothetical protein
VVGIAATYAMMFGVFGFTGGTIFSSVLSLAEGRRSLEQLSLPRFVAWGALLLGELAVTVGLLGPGIGWLHIAIVGARP